MDLRMAIQYVIELNVGTATGFLERGDAALGLVMVRVARGVAAVVNSVRANSIFQYWTTIFHQKHFHILQ